MNVLVACESSGRVRDAFLRRGHYAVSCDLLPSDAGGPHIIEDALTVLDSQRWDLVVAHPPCTYLSGATPFNQHPTTVERFAAQRSALLFALRLWEAKVPRFCLENPQGLLNSWRQPTQIINPFLFGEPIYKRTCLWLRGLPPLVPTNEVRPSAKDSRKWWDSLGDKKRPHNRSITFLGVAEAMADQWSDPDVGLLFPLLSR